MLERFRAEYKDKNVFSESFYSRDFDYSKPNQNASLLNFCFLIHRTVFEPLAKEIGFKEHNLIFEERKENQSWQKGASSFSKEVDQSSLIDRETTLNYCFHSEKPEFSFLYPAIKKQVGESHLVFLGQKAFEILNERFPELAEVKRVVFKTIDGLKPEVHLRMASVLIIDSGNLVKNPLAKSKLSEFVQTLQISEFLSQADLAELFAEIAFKNFGMAVTDEQECQISISKCPLIDFISLRNLLAKKTPVTIVRPNTHLSQYQLSDDTLFIFYFKNKGDDWYTVFPEQGKEDPDSASRCFIYPSNCSNCNFFLNRKISDRVICVCSRFYCNSVCKANDKGHICKPRSCRACNKVFVLQPWAIECGTFYCSTQCEQKDQTVHQNICSLCPKVKNEAKQTSTQMQASQNREPQKKHPRLVLLKDQNSYDPPKLEFRRNDFQNEGRVGLNNIGNTCYMNSALQIALHTDALKSFFLKSDFESEINEVNVLGTKGVLLREIGHFFRLYYNTNFQRITPSRLKSQVEEHNPTFRGLSQHDAQEFWSYFLDILHEDSNRIRRKPYVPDLESQPGKPDFEVARQSWVGHLRRNYSRVVEHFTGQFKSSVECPACGQKSVAFDPFNIIPLSVPTMKQREIEVFFLKPDEREKTSKYTVRVKSLGNFNDIFAEDLISCFAAELAISQESLRLAVFGFGCVGSLFEPKEPLSKIVEAVSQEKNTRIHLIELNDFDLRALESANSVSVLLKFEYDVNDPLKRNDYSCSLLARMQSEFHENPAFTKLFYLTTEHKVADLYACVLRKLLPASSIFDRKEKEQKANDQNFYSDYFRRKLQKNKHNFPLFYIKIGERVVTENFSEDKISHFLKKGENQLVITAFLSTKGSKSPVFKLDKFLAVTAIMQFDEEMITVASKDIAEFKSEYNLRDLLENFAKQEVLDSENSWFCPKCKKLVSARKTIKIYKTADHLVIQLKKLKENAREIPLIAFPIDQLDMSPFLLNLKSVREYKVRPEEFTSDEEIKFYSQKGKSFVIEGEEKFGENPVYKLFGVINHFGSQNAGHYTAFVKCADGEWVDFNDGDVSSMVKSKVISGAAYILFYKRC